MPSLTVRGPTGPPVRYDLSDGEITIGRSAGNALVIFDQGVSRVHARISKDGLDWMVEDLQSRNGTRLNGTRLVGRRRLAPDDELTIGKMVIVFEAFVSETLPEAPPPKGLPNWSGRGGAQTADPALLGESEIIRDLRSEIERVAAADVTTLLCGETGTGKELVAALIHRSSARRDAPFVVVNCPALPAALIEAELFGIERGVATGVERRTGRLETAQDGTLLLDEVGDLDAAAQAKLLRFLEDRKVERVGGRKAVPLDVRILASTNRGLEDAVESGAFRRDLFHRLDVYRITLPPLRERSEDIPLLAGHFLAAAGGGDISKEAMAVLQAHPLPGNVRQLKHAVERARVAAGGGEVLPQHLPPELTRPVVAGGATTDAVARLRDEVLGQGVPFWKAFREPFLRRDLSREDALRFVEWAHDEAGRSFKEMAALLGIPDEARKLENFLTHHRLKPRSKRTTRPD